MTANIILTILLLITLFVLANCIYENIKNKDKLKFSSLYVDMLIKNSNYEFFIYDEISQIRYKLINGKFIMAETGLDDEESKIHPDDPQRYKSEYNKTISKDKNHAITELKLYNATLNKYEYFKYVLCPVSFDKNGRITRYIYSKKNITEQREIEQEKTDLIKSLNLALLSANQMRWKHDIETKETIVYDKDSNEIKYNTSDVYSLIHPEDASKVKILYSDITKNQEYAPNVIRLYDPKDQIYKSKEVYSIISKDKNSKPIAVYGIVRDITEINKYQEKLKEKVSELEESKKKLFKVV